MNRREIKKLKDAMRNGAATRLVMSKVNDGTKMQTVQAVGLSGEIIECERPQNYGFSSNPPAGEAIGLPIGGDRGHMVILAIDDRGSRKGDVESGEVGVYHGNGDFIKLSSGNKIDVKTKEFLPEAETKVVIKTKDCAIEASGSITLKASTVTVEGNLVGTGSIPGGGGGQAASITGNMSVEGDVSVNGNITASGTITP